MNSVFLSNLSDGEFLRHINPETELERMLVLRLESPQADPVALAEAEDRACEAEEAQGEAENKAEELQNEIDNLRAYAGKLHAALAIAEPENELLDCEDYELLRE